MRTALDQVIDDYMKELQGELRGFPATRRREILDEVREHITQARAELDSETEAAIRTVLDRLGDPSEIAASARERFGVRPARAGALEIWTVITLMIPFFGWLIGAVLVWMSRVWKTWEKALTTILVPGVWVFFFWGTLAVSSSSTVGTHTCRIKGGKTLCNPPSRPPPEPGGIEWGTVLLVAVFVIPIAVSIYLAIRARQRSDMVAATS